MKFEALPIEGAFKITYNALPDHRGVFVKSFHADLFAANGLNTCFNEAYWSYSRSGVIRGMHFQRPPSDHEKLVTCISGRVLDVFLDLRVGSPSYGQSASVRLEGDSPCAVYLPKGIAHGFLSLQDDSLMYYMVGTPYDSANDAGIRWDSFGFDWGIENPILSERDRSFVGFSEYRSDFA